jgi:hypothetical protein
MSARQLRARLDRLTLCARTGQDRNGAHGFTIDPTLAKALRNDQQRLSELIRKRSPGQHGGSVSAAEVEEESRLRASIADATIEAIREALALHVGGKNELTRLLTAPADELIGELERLNLATLVIAEKLIQARLFEIPPKDIASVGKAIADTLLSTTARIGKERLLLPAERAGDDAKVTEHDELAPIWKSFRDEVTKLDAA